MESNKLVSQPLGMPLASSPKPKLRHDTTHARRSLLNLIPNQSTLFFNLSLVLLLRHPPPSLSFPTDPLSGRRRRFMQTTRNLTLWLFSQRICVVEPEATCLSSDEPPVLNILFLPPALHSSLTNFLPLQPTTSLSQPFAQAESSITC